MDEQKITDIINSYRSDRNKRRDIVVSFDLIEEKWFWAKFFEEIDKRSNFLTASFVVKNFGLRINSNRLLKRDVKSYSLMTYSDGTLSMNKTAKSGKKYKTWVERLADHCVDETIANKFHMNLKTKNLLLAGAIEPYVLVNGKDDDFIEVVISDIFSCLDQFNVGWISS